MTNLTKFCREAAKRYLQSIVFVDDEIYSRETGAPVEVSTDLHPFKSPFIRQDDPPAADNTTAPSGLELRPGDRYQPVAMPGANEPAAPPGPGVEPAGAAPTPAAVLPISPALTLPAAGTKPPYHPRQLVESFAREGMVCALYEPKAEFPSGNESEIFRLCERADVLILDWDLFGEDGKNILPLITNLIDQSQSTIPHHTRLCAIYTNKPDLARVANAVYESLQARGLKSQPVQQVTTLIAGATRVVVWGKPDVVGRPPDSKSLEVREEELADHVINEFATMHRGILPSYALHGMASVRRNSKRILDKFHSDMDGEFLLHRAVLLANEDAFEQLPEILAEEVLAVLLEDQVQPAVSEDIANERANALDLGKLDWPEVQHKNIPQRQEIARRFLGGGAAAIAAEYPKFKPDELPFPKFHQEMGCNKTHADKRLAALFNSRTRYEGSNPPSLGLGAIVRSDRLKMPPKYSLCLMPVCDSMRLKHGEGRTTAFPFWTLENVDGRKGLGFVVQTNEDTYVDLLVTGKPRDMLWTDRFAPGPSGTVLATEENSSFRFRGEGSNLEWVAQLKPAHAQRIALYIGQAFSRVDVLEAEWLRLKSKSS
jgi:hypothetical protein